MEKILGLPIKIRALAFKSPRMNKFDYNHFDDENPIYQLFYDSFLFLTTLVI